MSRRFVDSQIGNKQKIGQGIFDLSNQFELQQEGIWPNDTAQTTWIRPKDWLTIPTLTSTEQKFVGLLAIFDDDANFIALTAQGNYTVDWGDGTVQNFNSSTSVPATHSYTYSSISNTTLSSRGYKQVLVTVTPQAGQTFSYLNLNVRYTGLSGPYSTRWLDFSLNAPNLTTLIIRYNTSGSDPISGNTVLHGMLESVNIGANRINKTSYMFKDLRALRWITMNTDFVTDMSYMFREARIIDAPWLNTSNVINMSHMFDLCRYITTIPLYDTSSVTDMSYMFTDCFQGLRTIPKFNTSNVTTMRNMFTNCDALRWVPLLDTSNVTDMQYMFQMGGVIEGRLQTVPAFNTEKVTNMNRMFQNRYSIRRLPYFNTKNVTDFSYFAENCINLEYIPQYDLTQVSTIQRAFYNTGIQKFPELNLSNTTLTTDAFDSLFAVGSLNIKNSHYSDLQIGGYLLSTDQFNKIMANLGKACHAWTGSAVTRSFIIASGNYGAGTYLSKLCATTSGSNVITVNTNTSLTVGMELITGQNVTSPFGVVLSASTNTVNKTNHGIANGTPVSFYHIATTNGNKDISKAWTGYFPNTGTTGYITGTNFGIFGNVATDQHAIAYANGTWAIATPTGIYTTQTPSNSQSWVRVSGNQAFYTIAYATDPSALAYGGTGWWVASGSSAQTWYSADPNAASGTWVLATTGLTQNATCVKFLNGYWFVLAANGQMAYSAYSPANPWTNTTFTITNQLRSIDFNGSYYTIVTNAPTSGTYQNLAYVYYKAAGSPGPASSWAVAVQFGTGASFTNIIWANGCWVAPFFNIALNYIVGTNPNGAWQQIYPDTIRNSLNTGTIYSIEAGNNTWVLGTENGGIYTQPFGPYGTPPSASGWTRIHANWSNSGGTTPTAAATVTNIHYEENATGCNWLLIGNSTAVGTFNNSNVETYKPYYVVNASANSFQLAETVNGDPITINEDSLPNGASPTGCAMFVIPTITNIAGTSITLSAPATATASSQTFYFASGPKRHLARCRGWYVGTA